MKIQEAIEIFSHLWDKYRDEGIPHAEMCRHINNAQVAVLKNQFYSRKDRSRRSQYSEPRYGFENTSFDSESWRQLIYNFPNEDAPFISTDDEGRLYFSEIENYFPDDIIRDEVGEIERRKPQVFHINRIARWGGSTYGYKKVKWFRHNELDFAKDNPHLTPTDKYPGMVIYRDYIQFFPKDERVLDLSVTRMPLHVWYDEVNVQNNIDPELPDSTMYDVIVDAAKLGALNIREPQLYQMLEAERGNL